VARVKEKSPRRFGFKRGGETPSARQDWGKVFGQRSGTKKSMVTAAKEEGKIDAGGRTEAVPRGKGSTW